MLTFFKVYKYLFIFSDDPIAISRKNGHFSAYMLINEVGDDHAGTYRCFATDQITVYEGTKMDIKISSKENYYILRLKTFFFKPLTQKMRV